MATSVEQKPALGSDERVRGVRDRLTSWTLAGGLAPFAAALLAYLVVFAVMNPGTTGDEPHYLLVSESIAFDGDVDLTNDYASRERTLRVVNVYPLDPSPHAADYKGTGQLRPLHGVGLSALVAPGVAVGGLTGARLVMVLIAALLAHQLYRLLAELGFRTRYRIAAWVATAFCLPILAFSSQVYPELPGALLVIVVLRVLLRHGGSPWALALASTASAALVWLHVRYFPISFALLLGLAYVATSDRAPPVGARGSGLRGVARRFGAELGSRSRAAARRWRTVAVPVLAPYAAVLVVFFGAFQYWYGSPDPRTPYYAYSTTNVGSGGWKFLYDYGVHDLFNPLAGWIPFVPVHWLGLAALGCAVLWFGWPAVACIAAAAGYEVILASAGPVGGWGLPARYLIIVIPLIAVPLAVVVQQIRLARFVFVPLLAGSLVLAVAAVNNHEGLYPAGERQTIVGLRSIATAFPVTRPPQPATTMAQIPGLALSQTGRVEGDRVVAKEGRDKPGFVLYGGYTTLKSGAYRSRFALAATGVGPDEHVANIEVVAGGTVLGRELVTGRELRRRLVDFDLSFATLGDVLVEARVYYHGRGTLEAGPVYVEPLTVATPAGHFRDWPLAFVWVAGTVLVGALLLQVMLLSRRTVPS